MMLPILGAALVAGGASLVSGMIQGSAAKHAANVQSEAAMAGIE